MYYLLSGLSVRWGEGGLDRGFPLGWGAGRSLMEDVEGRLCRVAKDTPEVKTLVSGTHSCRRTEHVRCLEGQMEHLQISCNKNCLNIH